MKPTPSLSLSLSLIIRISHADQLQLNWELNIYSILFSAIKILHLSLFETVAAVFETKMSLK